MKTNFIILIFLFYQFFLSAQNYPTAPEIWSEPVRIDSFSARYEYEESPSLTYTLDTIYFIRGNAIYTSHLIDGVWQSPVKLNGNINNGLPVRNPSISKDGKRLYFSRWEGYGAWDIWYSDWNSNSNDWGMSYNIGTGINTSTTEWSCFEKSKDSLYVVTSRVVTSGVCLFVWNQNITDWELRDSFYFHPLGGGNIESLSITENGKKLYYSKYVFPSHPREYEICVVYWDSLSNQWGNPYFLNINSSSFQPDSNMQFHWVGGWDRNPWISSNGKVLFFKGNRDNAINDTSNSTDIYISRLLIDENGDPVSVKYDSSTDEISSDKKEILFQNYPNPFNSTTTFAFQLEYDTNISLIIYNALGQEILKVIDNASLNRGTYRYAWYGTDKLLRPVSGGVYFYTLRTNNSYITNKLIYTP